MQLPRWIAHCHWWPMIDSRGSLCSSTSLKRNIFHRQVCPWTLKRWWISNTIKVHENTEYFVHELSWISTRKKCCVLTTWISMKIHVFLPWNPMNVHVHSWTFIANSDWGTVLSRQLVWRRGTPITSPSPWTNFMRPLSIRFFKVLYLDHIRTYSLT